MSNNNKDIFHFKVLIFAKVKELLNNQNFITIGLENGDNTTFKLIEEISKKYPQIKSTLDISLIAINQEYIQKDQNIIINPNDEIAIIPPVSGG